MRKNKKDIAELLDNCTDMVSEIAKATELFAKAAVTALTIVEVIKRFVDSTTDAEVIVEEKPKKVIAKTVEAEPEPEPEAVTKEKTYTKVDVRKRLAAIAETDREAVKTLLSKYGAETLTQLSEDHYADIMADAEDL